ncbi:MAG: hypothetical protein IID45_07930 [Planctomycetes bacterium]|nr:hypothetical protein [Planctomycetota bacterium]
MNPPPRKPKLTVFRILLVLLILLPTGLLLTRHLDGRGLNAGSTAPLTLADKHRVSTAEMAALAEPLPESDPHYQTDDQRLLRTRRFVIADKLARYETAMNDGSAPETTAPADARTTLFRRRMNEGIRLIRKHRGRENGFARHEIEWIHNLPMQICWYNRKYLGRPVVFYFDIDTGRWTWNHGTAFSGREGQLEYALHGVDPATEKVKPGPLSRSSKVGLVNEILAGLAAINARGSAKK